MPADFALQQQPPAIANEVTNPPSGCTAISSSAAYGLQGVFSGTSCPHGPDNIRHQFPSIGNDCGDKHYRSSNSAGLVGGGATFIQLYRLPDHFQIFTPSRATSCVSFDRARSSHACFVTPYPDTTALRGSTRVDFGRSQPRQPSSQFKDNRTSPGRERQMR